MPAVKQLKPAISTFLWTVGAYPEGWTIGGLYEDLCAALGKELDMITTTCPDRPFLARIKSDEVTLYES